MTNLEGCGTAPGIPRAVAVAVPVSRWI